MKVFCLKYNKVLNKLCLYIIIESWIIRQNVLFFIQFYNPRTQKSWETVAFVSQIIKNKAL